MKYIRYIALLLTWSVPIFAQESADASGINLGSGFMEVRGNENGQNVRLLYFRDKKIGRFGSFSISPSGTYAAYQESPSGNLYLFRAEDQSVEQLTQEFIAPAKKFSWDERMEIVEVKFNGKSESQSFALE